MKLTDIDEITPRIERLREHAMSILSLIQDLETLDVHPSWDESRVKLYLDDAVRAVEHADSEMGACFDISEEMIP